MKLKVLPVRGDEYLEEISEESMVAEVEAILKDTGMSITSPELTTQNLVMIMAWNGREEGRPINLRAWEIANTKEPIVGVVVIGRRKARNPWACGEYLPA